MDGNRSEDIGESGRTPNTASWCRISLTPPADRSGLPAVGTWLSLVEHSLGVRGVGSSNLPVPTILFSSCYAGSTPWENTKARGQSGARILRIFCSFCRRHVPASEQAMMEHEASFSFFYKAGQRRRQLQRKTSNDEPRTPRHVSRVFCFDYRSNTRPYSLRALLRSNAKRTAVPSTNNFVIQAHGDGVVSFLHKSVV